MKIKIGLMGGIIKPDWKIRLFIFIDGKCKRGYIVFIERG